MKIFYTRRDGNKQIFYLGLLLCLKTLAKLQNAREASGHPALMNNYTASSHMPSSYQSTNWFVISPFQVVRGAWDSVATRGASREESWHEMDAGKRTQKYIKDDKETVCSYHVTYAF